MVAALAVSADVTKAQVNSVLNALERHASGELVEGNSVILPGIGKLVVTTRAARAGRNPKTGETLQVPASRTVKFRLTAGLKAAVK